jgi:hypothetical protein
MRLLYHLLAALSTNRSQIIYLERCWKANEKSAETNQIDKKPTNKS